MDNLFSKNVTPLCGLNLGAEHRDICSKFIEDKILRCRAPKHDANNIVLFIQNACIKNNSYQYNYLIYNLISIFQQTLIYRFRLQIIEY